MNTSVCVPTYNRKECALRVIEEHVKSLPSIPLIVSDNNSSDGTLEALTEYAGSNVTVLTNKGEPTFGSNVTNALRSCKTEWAILCSDEDSIIPEAMHSISNLISKTDVDLILASVAPGGANKGVPVLDDGRPDFNRIFSYTYMSGIVIKPSQYLDLLNLMESEPSLKHITDYFLSTYLLWLAYARGSLYCTSTQLIKRNINLPTQQRVKSDHRGRVVYYATVEGRWQQFMAAGSFIDLLEPLCAASDGWSDRVTVMRNRQRASLIPLLRAGIHAENSEIVRLFDEGIAREYSKLASAGKIMLQLRP